MTQGSWPGAVSFDPDGGGARYWEEALATQGERPRVLVVISGEAARYSGWSARAVVSLADALALRGPVIVADLHFEQPELDGMVAERDAEGVADAILYGASLDRVVRPVAQHQFEVVPAGGPVADPEGVMRSDAWSRVLEEARRRDASLLLYVPWRARGVDGLAKLADRAIMLGGNTDARLASGYLPPDFPVSAVLSPATPRAGTAPPTALAEAAAERTRVATRTRVPMFAVLALAAVASVVALAYRSRGRPASETPPPAAVSPPPATAATPAGTPLPYAVAIEAHQELFTAATRIRQLAAADSAAGFFLAPTVIDSVLYYQVMAGPVADSLSAATLMTDLLARGTKTGGTEWDIRYAPLSFDLGEFGSRVAADAQATLLYARRIPAYVLAVPYSDGTERYHIYCGAWAGPAEADHIRQILEGAAINASLVQRTGRSTS